MTALLPDAWAEPAKRNLPRYTSYPTAINFTAARDDRQARDWLSRTRSEQAISAYVHVPFCRRLCWYCGCHTTVAHTYKRVAAFRDTLAREVDLWTEALGPHAGLAHLHFGGGSPNALSPEHFLGLVRLLADSLALRPGAEIAAELDPGVLADSFIDAAGEAGVTRVSLGVQTFDSGVQAKVNRIQPYARVSQAVTRIRAAGIEKVNFDLMYGLPGQTPEKVRASVEAALTLRPDRVAVFGYAHVPWMKKHQVMVRDAELAGVNGRWAQAEAADCALVENGYVRIGFDHYALPNDPLALASARGGLRRNFQGYTTDPAPVLIPIGPSSIGRLSEGFVQNTVATGAWSAAVATGRLPVARQLRVTADDELRADVIERLMCDLTADVEALCRKHGFQRNALDDSLARVAALEAAGLAHVRDRVVTVPDEAFRMVRVAAACFDAHLSQTERRHALAV